MRFSTTWRLMLVVTLLVGAVWLVHRPDADGIGDELRKRIFAASPEDVTALAVSTPDLSLGLVRKTREWFLESPVRARADVLTVDRTLATIDGITVYDRVTLAQRQSRDLDLTDYGLDIPRLSFVVESQRGRETLAVGMDTPLGGRLFALAGDSQDVLVIDRGVLEVIPRAIADYRDRRLVRASPENVVRLEVQHAGRGFVQLARTDDGWVLRQPFFAPADGAVIHQLLRVLQDARIKTFVWDPDPVVSGSSIAARAQFEACGLSEDMAQIRIGVWEDGDGLGEEISLGKPVPDSEGDLFARRREIGSVYAVPVAIAAAFDRGAESLRDRRMYTGVADRIEQLTIEHMEERLVLARQDGLWRVLEPTQCMADQGRVLQVISLLSTATADQFVSVSATNLVQLGLDPAMYRLDICSGEESTSVSIGSLTNSDAFAWCRVSDRDEVMRLPTDVLAWLRELGTDALRYRDRIMLQLPAESVWRISRRYGDDLQSIARHATTREWQVADAVGVALNPEGVHGVLRAVGMMEAASIVAQNPPSLKPFGLDPEPFSLSFGLRGDDGIMKTVVIGAATEGGSFAMVRGQDIVFVLSDALIDALGSDLVRPAPKAVPAPAQGSGPSEASTVR